MTEKSTYEVLLEMAPEEKRAEIEKIFRKNKHFNDENDGLFQFLMAMGIYSDFLIKIPQTIKDSHDQLIRVIEKNARIEKNFRILVIAVYVAIAALTGVRLFEIISNSHTSDSNPSHQTEAVSDANETRS